MPGHPPDDAGIVPVSLQAEVGLVAVGEQRRPRRDVGLDERLDVRGGVAGDRLQPHPAGHHVVVFRPYLQGLLPLFPGPVKHLDGAGHDDLAGLVRVEEGLGATERHLRLVDLDHPLEGPPLRIDHGAPELLGEEPGGAVGETELALELGADMPLAWVAMR